jgi:hypothetical protein
MTLRVPIGSDEAISVAASPIMNVVAIPASRSLCDVRCPAGF